MIKATKEFLNEIDKIANERKQEILNTTDALEISGNAYYVSADGDDLNDGRTPETPWKTIRRANFAWLQPGDGVFFRRGDLFRGCVETKHGVSYGAYGEGDKPKIYSWDKNLADPELWEEFNAEKHIWKLKEGILDVGALVFNDGEQHTLRKHIPSFRKLGFVCRDDYTKPFIMEDEMTDDLDMYCHFDSILMKRWAKDRFIYVPQIDDTKMTTLYLRCEKGNPGEIFNSIEALTKRPIFKIWSNKNVTIDNICMKYCGAHAVAAGGHVVGLHVTNCELGWIGGSTQYYMSVDENDPEGETLKVTRYGNGVEIYGGCEDFVVCHNYLYQIYDAAITQQMVALANSTVVMDGMKYNDNLIETTVYPIEYFMAPAKNTPGSYMDNFEICNNIMIGTGYGWGQQRPDPTTPSHIKSWESTNTCPNFLISNNIFHCSSYRMIHIKAKTENDFPTMKGNTYIQHLGNLLCDFGIMGDETYNNIVFDENAEKIITEVFGETDGKIYYLED